MSMNSDVTIYKSKKTKMLTGLGILAFVLIGITLPAILSGEVLSQQKIVGQGIFILFGLLLTLAPLAGRFEVGKDYIKAYFFGICVDHMHASDIETIKYGKIIRWGVVGMGNGLMGWVKTKNGHRYFSFSETGYGKEAILHAKRVLEQHIVQSQRA